MTDELDEIIDNLKITLKFAYGVSISEHELQHHKQAIQALIADQMAEYQAQLLKDYKEDIATAVREARIDELIGVRGWTEYEPDPKYSPAERFHIVPYTYLTKRIEELKRSKE